MILLMLFLDNTEYADNTAYSAAYAGGGYVNPIEKIRLLVSQRMDQLDIVPVNVGSNNNDGGSGGAGGGGGSAGCGKGGQDVTDNVCSGNVSPTANCGGYAERGELLVF